MKILALFISITVGIFLFKCFTTELFTNVKTICYLKKENKELKKGIKLWENN